jgi:hypothetical protein
MRARLASGAFGLRMAAVDAASLPGINDIASQI